MAVPTLVTDLSTTLASNSPAGSENVFPNLDDYLRALSGFLASIRDNSGNGWVSPYLTAASPTYTGTLTGGTGVVALGTNQFYKDASGNVVIGAITAVEKVTLNQGNYYAVRTGGAKLRLADQFNEISLESVPVGSGSEAIIKVGTTERLRVDQNGNVGIGSTAPVATLELKNAGFYPRVAFTKTSVGAWYVGGEGSGAGVSFQINLNTSNAVTIDSALNVGVGGAPSVKLDVQDASAATVRARTTTSGNASLIATTAAGGTAVLELTNAAGSNFIYGGMGGTQNLSFVVGSERARIDSSGNLLVGTTSAVVITNGGHILNTGSASSRYIGHASGTSSGAVFDSFYYAGTQIGTITQSGTTAVLYNTTSDQRLKTNIVDAPDAAALIDSIKVRSFDWISDESHQRYGMVAQELFEVAPEAVHAPADPDEMMAVDYSKLVPMLVKEIQSLRARVAALEA